MKRVTRNNLLRLMDMMKEYQENQDNQLLDSINQFVENVINKDTRYYSKLQTYDFDNEILQYLM